MGGKAAMVIEEIENLRRQRVNINLHLEVVFEQDLSLHFAIHP